MSPHGARRVAIPPILVELERGGFVESRHRAHAAVVDADGAVVAAAGDFRMATYWRSAAKPVQAMLMVLSGATARFGLGAEALAVACGSHGGQEAHTAAVERMLAAADLQTSDLGCPAHPPLHRPSREALERTGAPPTRLHAQCSGKHAGMLLSALALDLPLAGYMEPTHPLQKRIRSLVEEMAGEEVRCVGVDGCCAPTFALSLTGMARAYARLARPQSLPEGLRESAAQVAEAMGAHPLLVGADGFFDTELMRAMPGLIVKGGAESVLCVGIKERGWGLALKVEDGSERARPPAALAALEALGIEAPPELDRFRNPEVTNTAGDAVGVLRVRSYLDGWGRAMAQEMDMPERIRWVSGHPGATAALAERLAAALQPGDCVALMGPLGVGKTHFVKGLAEGLGVDPAEVTSPTFTLLQRYAGRLPLLHADAYRLVAGEEWLELAAEEWAEADGAVMAVEWAERVAPFLPPERLEVRLDYKGAGEGRSIEFAGLGERGRRLAAAACEAIAAFSGG